MPQIIPWAIGEGRDCKNSNISINSPKQQKSDKDKFLIAFYFVSVCYFYSAVISMASYPSGIVTPTFFALSATYFFVRSFAY